MIVLIPGIIIRLIIVLIIILINKENRNGNIALLCWEKMNKGKERQIPGGLWVVSRREIYLTGECLLYLCGFISWPMINCILPKELCLALRLVTQCSLFWKRGHFVYFSFGCFTDLCSVHDVMKNMLFFVRLSCRYFIHILWASLPLSVLCVSRAETQNI